MNIADVRSKPEQAADCDFEGCHHPSAIPCRAFMHGYADVPYHWHREIEILFVLRGSVRLVLDGQACEMNPEDLVIINGDVPHNSTSISRDALICGVHLDAAYYERCGLPGFGSRQYLCRTFLHARSFMRNVAPIKALMARLILDRGVHAGEELVRRTVGNLLASYIYRWIPYETSEVVASTLRADSRDRILRIMHSLEGRDDSQQLGIIAVAEGLTLSHLSRLFKRHLGVGYRDYSQNLRLDCSAEELRTTNLTISDVMSRNGFGNPAVFYNKFRARFGCSPARYRRGGGPTKPQSTLSEEDAAVARGILLDHATGVANAAELAIGPTSWCKRQTLLHAPHYAS